jgi:hypothetical protein
MGRVVNVVIVSEYGVERCGVSCGRENRVVHLRRRLLVQVQVTNHSHVYSFMHDSFAQQSYIARQQIQPMLIIDGLPKISLLVCFLASRLRFQKGSATKMLHQLLANQCLRNCAYQPRNITLPVSVSLTF